MKKKILVTGGTGFLGYHLLKKLSKQDYSLYSLSTKKPTKQRKIKKVKYITCDICNKNVLKRKLKDKYNYIVNFSGYVDHTNKSKTIQSHYYGCKNLINLFRNKKIDNFIQIGSSMEYGNSFSPHSEKFICKPKGNYGIAKYKATKYLEKIHKIKSFPYTIFRLYQVYGPNQSKNRLIPVVIDSCLKNKNFGCTSGGQIRDFLYIDDLIKLIIKSIKKKPMNKIYNVGAGNKIKVKFLIDMINRLIGSGKPIYGKIKMRKDEMKNNFPNIKRVKSDYSWEPKCDLKAGLKKTISFYRNN